MIGHADKNDSVFSLENYEGFYEHHTFEPIPENICTTINEWIPRFAWAFDQVQESGGKTLLDLGCLDGSFALSCAKQLGLAVTGVDLTKDGIQLAKERTKKYGLDAEFYQGFIEQVGTTFADEGRKFDVITFFEIIEHVEDVKLALEIIDELLAPGGTVLVSTPDFESPIYGADDEQNKCHIRLYTTADEDYERANKYGTIRKATSIQKEIGKERIKEMAVHNELINVRYQ